MDSTRKKLYTSLPNSRKTRVLISWSARKTWLYDSSVDTGSTDAPGYAAVEK
ncbi:hypothetical protein PV328_002732, partial [Microctonus aethiopoides]